MFNRVKVPWQYVLTALFLVTAILLAAYEIINRSFGARLSSMPITVTLISNAILLFITYIVIEELISRKDASRWRNAAIDIVTGIKSHGDRLDREIFQIIRRYMKAHKIKGPTTANSRDERNAAVKEYLVAALTDRESLLVEKTETLVEPEGLAEIMSEFTDTVRFSTAALTSSKEFYPVLDALPALKVKSGALVRKLSKAIRDAQNHPQVGCSQVVAESVLAAWQEYEIQRAVVSEHALPIMKPNTK